MTQTNKEQDTDGKMDWVGIASGAEKLLFEKQIVPMWLSTEATAKILGISPNAVRIRKCRGQLQCQYFGKYLRFSARHLNSLIRENRKEN